MNWTFFTQPYSFGPNGFVKDKYIGENIRLLSDLMECMDVKKLFGIFLFISF